VHGLWGKPHGGEWSADFTRRRAAALLRAPVEPFRLEGMIERALALAAALDATVCDALSIALAEQGEIPLISDDKPLLRRLGQDSKLRSLMPPLAEISL